MRAAHLDALIAATSPSDWTQTMRTVLIRLAATTMIATAVAVPAGARGHRPRRLPEPPIRFCDHVKADVEALARRGGGVPGFWYWRMGPDRTVAGPLHYPTRPGPSARATASR